MTSLTVNQLVRQAEAPLNGPPLLPQAVGIQPRQYQVDAIKFLFTKKRAMLTDAPGLGKTIQGTLASVPPVLIVVPNYLVGQWGAWLGEHFPESKTVACQGDRWKKYAQLFDGAQIDSQTGKMLPGQPATFVVINKEMCRTHIDELLKVIGVFNTIIVDESHHFRNRRAEQSKNLDRLTKSVPRLIEMTATPIWKEVDDLYWQLHMIAPTVFSSYGDFIELYCITDATRYGIKVYGVKPEMMAELNEILDVVRIGRTYEDAQRELPPVMDSVVYIQFDKTMRQLYDDAVENYRVKFAEEDGSDLFLTSMGAVLNTLRQFCAWPGKIEAIKQILEDTEPYDHGRPVIFCWYRETARLLGEAFPGSTVITGAITDPDERRRLAHAASAGHTPIIATIASLSEGVDLSDARHVVFAEEHYAPGSHVQSLARVVRERQIDEESTGIPQASTDPWDIILRDLDSRNVNAAPVLVHYVVVKDSIDETIHKTTRRRGDTIKSILKEALGMF